MSKVVRKVKRHVTGIRKEVVKQMLTLSTSGFGLVAALAWNELIKEVVTRYIKPLFGANSGVVSLLIYAILITVLAVFVTFNLTKIVKKNDSR